MSGVYSRNKGYDFQTYVLQADLSHHLDNDPVAQVYKQLSSTCAGFYLQLFMGGQTFFMNHRASQ